MTEQIDENKTSESRGDIAQLTEEQPAVNEVDIDSPPKISKKQQKRLRKEQEREEQYGNKRVKTVDPDALYSVSLQPESNAKLSILLDCDFDNLMSVSEIKSNASQISHCYGLNRRSDRHINLLISGLECADNLTPSPQRLKYDGSLHSTKRCLDIQNAHQWQNVKFYKNSFSQCLKEQFNKMIYLTADTESFIGDDEYDIDFDSDTILVIGAIVDKNRHKNLCATKAKELGIRPAALPIGKFIQLSTRHVLTTNHVFEILLKYLQHKDWEKAFLEVIPKRKFD
ncbi:hypothetical protein MP228_007613 [Amoeboaphelidium protococcarum]|nr:hypothetical protein MP228_007613 [Amoeboaphelidium protococcarum]